MSSSAKYEFKDLLSDLDGAINLLNEAAAKLKARQINSDNFRIRYDNHPLTIGLAAAWLISSIRNNCITETRILPLAYFCVRPLQELCINVASVNYLESSFSQRQLQLLRESRLMSIIAEEKDVQNMQKLLDAEQQNITKKCFDTVQALIKSYDPTKHYKNRGFNHSLNELSSQKIKGLFSQIDSTHVENHPIFKNFMREESEGIFSGLLHGNPTTVFIASDNNDNRPTIPFILLRLSLYDAELIAGYLSDEELKTRVVALRDSVLIKAYGAGDT